MWLHRFTHYILRHRWLTLALVFSCTFLSTYLGKFVAEMPVLLSLLSMLVAVLLGTLAITMATLVTLVKGIVEGAALTIFATLPYIVSIYVPGGDASSVPALSLWVGVGVAVTSNILTWAFAVMLRRQASWSFILQMAALLGVLVVSVIHLVFPSVVDWWGNQLQALQNFYAQAAAAATGAKDATPATTQPQADFINFAKQLVNGILVTAILCNAMVQLIVARWWQAIVYMPGALRRELHAIRLTPLAGLLFVMSLVLSYLGNGNSVVLDIMPILYMLFGAAGLSLIHYMFGLMKSPTVWFWLSLFYVTLIIASPFSLAVITMLALLDIWMDLRKRLSKA